MNYLTYILDAFSFLRFSTWKNKIFSLLTLILLLTSLSPAASFSVRVSNNNDDAEQDNGDTSMYLDSSDLELAYDGGTRQEIGMRFRNVTIPSGAIITSAYIQFTVDETDSGTTNLILYGENTNDAVGFTNSNNDIGSRPLTSASVNWSNVPAWNSVGAHAANQQTPDISSLIQEIVNRGGWSSGNDMVIVIKPGAGCNSSSCQRTAESHDGSSGSAPKLFIEYSLAEVPPIMQSIPNQNAVKDEVFNFSLASYTTQTNGDAISSYTLTGALPAGLSFDSNSGDIVGTPTATGTYTLNASATDNDGTSDIVTFDIIVTDAPLTCTDYDSSNHGNPGRVVTNMDGITASRARCIEGDSAQSEAPNQADFYLFTVQTDGTLDITANSPNNHDYHLRVGSSHDGQNYYSDTTAQNHTVPTINLTAGDTVYIRVKETGDNRDEYEIHFNFIAANPAPIANAGPDQYIEAGDDVTLDGSASIDDGSIVSYSWSTGDTGVSPTITGLGVGIHTITLTVTDNEGATGTDTVNIAVSGPGNDAPVIVSNGGADTASITITSSQTHVTNVHAIDPDGDTVTYSIVGGADSTEFTINPSTGVLSLNSIGSPGSTYVVIVTVVDPSGESDSQTITVTVDDPLVLNVGDRPFTVRNPPNTRNIRGNYVIGGNMNLCEDDGSGHCRTDNGNSNGNPDIYIDIDNDPTTHNSTTFDLDLPADANILWAGLYWQGVVHRSFHNGDFMGGTVPSNAPLLGGSTNQIDLTDNTYGAETVKFKIPGATDYIDVVANQLDYSRLGYSGFANVTSLIDTVNFNGTYTLADLKCHTGAEPDHGNYGGWALVIIYSQQDEHFKNITLFDGFATVDSSYNDSLIINGFLTPKNPPIESKIAFFTMDGEGGENYLRVISNKVGGAGTKISGPGNPPNSLFNSTIEGVNNRQPNLPSLRMDLDIIDLVDVLVPSESGATLQPRTKGDRFTPSFFIMSSDLIAPELCYDYSLYVGDAKLNSLNRDMIAYSGVGNTPLETKIIIRSMVADFDFEQAKAFISFKPDPSVNAATPNAKPLYITDTSYVSPAGINAYLHVLEINASAKGLIGIGHGIFENQENPNGGTINPDESTYFKQKFNLPDSTFQGRFDINVEGYVDYLNDGKPFYFPLSTRDGSISRCPINQTYDAIPGAFNVENPIAAAHRPDYERYPLYTQTAGKDYEIVLASYTKSGDGKFNVPLNSNMTVEVELIDAKSYENNSTLGYDSTCENPEFASKGGFISFNGNNRILLNPTTDLPDFDDEIALKSAAFKIMFLTKKDVNDTRIMVEHHCTNAEDHGCFQTIYQNHYESAEDNTTQYCTALCNTGTPAKASQCYDCLKKYFATPICSRDNFAIRPEAFSVSIGDNGDPHDTTIPKQWFSKNFVLAEVNTTVAAGYEYLLDINATIYPSLNTLAKKYENNSFKKHMYPFGTLPSIHSRTSLSAIEFKDKPACIDRQERTLKMAMANAQLDGDHFIKFTNVGKYSFTVTDSAWTEVDQALYPYKTEFGNGKQNECTVGSTQVPDPINSKVGCTVSSNTLGDGWGNKAALFIDVQPYKYDLSNIQFFNHPTNDGSFLYMSNLNAADSTARNMAVKLEGNITARGKDDTILSNFEDGCAPEDVTLWLSKTMLPTAANIHTDDNSSTVNFLQGLLDRFGIFTTVDNNATNIEMNSTLAKDNFISTPDLNGSAVLDLYYNFEKPLSKAVNPVDVNFSTLYASTPTALMNANLVSDHTPDGNITFSQTRRFFFARLFTRGADNANVFDADFNTRVIVQAYCDNSSIINCATDNNLTAEDTNWFRVNGHITTNGFGGIQKIHSADINVELTSGLQVKVNPLLAIQFDANGSTPEITIGYPLNVGRPAHPEIIITPDPWLLYSTKLTAAGLAGLPSFIPNFLTNGLRWKGVGKTGNVVSTEPSAAQSNRMSW